MMKVSIMKRRPKKSKKVNIDAIWEGVCCQNCFNEGHFTKECKLLLKFCQMCKASDHNTNHCPIKIVSGSCPSREIIQVHVIQAKIPIVQEPKQLSNYNVQNDHNQYNNQQYNARPNGRNWQNNNHSNQNNRYN